MKIARSLPQPVRRRLAAARKDEGLTRAQLAVAIGVDPATVARWEAGATHPSPLALAALVARYPAVFAANARDSGE